MIGDLAVGGRVAYTAFGLGMALAIRDIGPKQQVNVDFGSTRKKRLAVSHTPMEKLQTTESRSHVMNGASTRHVKMLKTATEW